MRKCDDCEQPAVFHHIYEDWADFYCDQHSLRALVRDMRQAKLRNRPLDEVTVELVPA